MWFTSGGRRYFSLLIVILTALMIDPPLAEALIKINMDGCDVWANNKGEPLQRRSGGYMLLRSPCFSHDDSGDQYWSEAIDDNTVIVHDVGQSAVAVYK